MFITWQMQRPRASCILSQDGSTIGALTKVRGDLRDIQKEGESQGLRVRLEMAYSIPFTYSNTNQN